MKNEKIMNSSKMNNSKIEKSLNGKNSKQYSCSKCQHTKEGLLFYSITNDNDYSFCKHLHYNLLNNNNDENANFIKIQDDPRITKVGKFIRNTSIDELPQLINVIKGDMSLVGNRPIPIYEAEKLTKDELCKRFLSPAGLTGIWQVEHRGKKGKMSDRERIELDNKYSDYFIQNKHSLWIDVKILLKTIPAIFQKNNV